MDGLGYVAALVLAAVFARAAQAKLGDRAGTAETFAALGLPGAAATAVPAVELAVAIGLVLVPGWSGIVALALLAGFTAFLWRALRAGVTVGCNCFGRARSAPISGVELVRNALLGGLAVVAGTASGPEVPGVGAVLAVAAAVAAGVALLHVLDRPREGPPVGASAPPVAGLRWADAPTTVLAFTKPNCPGCAAARAELAGLDGVRVHEVELDDRTRPLFGAYGVIATPFFVAVDDHGVVRRAGDRVPR
jgi:hypothetical protein